MTQAQPRLVTGPSAAALRRELGPVAWCALECLVERSDDGATTEASVRVIAADLGVAKNTAHRAVAALARAGLIELIQDRHADGRFRSGRYRLHLDDLLGPRTPPPRPRNRPQPLAAPTQLTLLTPA